jgi:hypothetical protein
MMWGRKMEAPSDARKVLCGGEWATTTPSKKLQDGVSSAARKQRILEAMMKLSERGNGWCWCDEIAKMVGEPPFVTPQSVGRHLREMMLIGLVKRSPNRHRRGGDESDKNVHRWTLA